MSEKLAAQCDACGRTTFDRYIELGWIEWRGGGAVSISIDRRPDGQSRTCFWSGGLKPLDFCNAVCLVKWLAAIPGPWPREGSTSSVGPAPAPPAPEGAA